MPAGLNNIVGIKPSKGLVSTRGVVPAAQSVDCVSIFAHTVGVAARVLQAAAGYDPLDPFSRRLTLTATPWPARFRFGVPAVLPFFGDSLAEAAFHQAVQKLCELCGTPATIDDAPLAGAAALLYDSALVAERYAAVRSFFDAHADEVIEPVRSIVAGGRNHSAADLVDAQVKLRAFGQQAAVMWDSIDVLLVPTTPTHYTIAQMQADPVALVALIPAPLGIGMLMPADGSQVQGFVCEAQALHGAQDISHFGGCYAPVVVDLAREGFPLLGGRLDYVDGRAVAALVYARGGHVINLFVRPEGEARALRTGQYTRQGYNLSGWNQSSMQFWAVTDASADELSQFMGAMNWRLRESTSQMG